MAGADFYAQPPSPPPVAQLEVQPAPLSPDLLSGEPMLAEGEGLPLLQLLPNENV